MRRMFSQMLQGKLETGKKKDYFKTWQIVHFKRLKMISLFNVDIFKFEDKSSIPQLKLYPQGIEENINWSVVLCIWCMEISAWSWDAWHTSFDKGFLMILSTVGLGAVFSKQSKKFELLQFVKTLDIYGNRPSHWW